jgi:hypothetical protein
MPEVAKGIASEVLPNVAACLFYIPRSCVAFDGMLHNLFSQNCHLDAEQSLNNSLLV